MNTWHRLPIFVWIALLGLGCGASPSDTFDAGVGSDTFPPPHKVCDPGLAFCDGNTLWLCNDQGTDLKSVTCTGVCDQAQCKEACEPDTTRCVSSHVLEICNPGGLATTQSCEHGCFDGYCAAAPVCEAGTLTCDPVTGEIRKCNSMGTAEFLFETCENTCDPATGMCIIAICAPEERRCAADTPKVVEVCSDDLTSWTKTEFCEDKCEAGHCMAINCQVGDIQCGPDGIEACKADESGFEVTEACDQGCIKNADNQPVCALCTKHHTKCDGELLLYCMSSLEGWVPYQQCGSLEKCIDGYCKPIVVLDPTVPMTVNYLLLTKAFVACWNVGEVGFCREISTAGLIYPITASEITDWFCKNANKSDFLDEDDYDTAKDIMGCGFTNVEDLSFETGVIHPNLVGEECIAFSDKGLANSKEIVITACENLK